MLMVLKLNTSLGLFNRAATSSSYLLPASLRCLTALASPQTSTPRDEETLRRCEVYSSHHMEPSVRGRQVRSSELIVNRVVGPVWRRAGVEPLIGSRTRVALIQCTSDRESGTEGSVSADGTISSSLDVIFSVECCALHVRCKS